jgi:signal peptidase I
VLSLIVWTCIFAVLLPLGAWVLAWAARRAGSTQARVRTGFLAVVILTGVSLVFETASKLIPAKKPLELLVIRGGLLVLQLGVAYFVLKALFRLSSKQAFIPFAANVILGLVSLILILAIIRPLVSEAFVMPTASMSPTIEARDCFFADKLLCPRRFDLVVYRNNDEAHAIYCKRLIALPGERLRFENGAIYINDQLASPPAGLAGRYHAAPGAPGNPGTASARYHDRQTITLGADENFLVGDNVDISADSRSYGPSQTRSLIGVVDLIYWPPPKMRIIR